MPARAIRKLRHWKQRFNPDAAFVCRRRLAWGERIYEPGDPVPEGLARHKGKLRRFWESGQIELAEFETTKRVKSTDFGNAAKVEAKGGGWYIVSLPDGRHRKVQGRNALEALLAELGAEEHR